MSLLAAAAVRASRTSGTSRTLLTASLMARHKHTLPALPYEYQALEPFISGEIMTLHHTKHHQTYVNGLNAAEQEYANLGDSLADAKKKIALQSALKFNGGGHINHSLFWTNLAPVSAGGGSLKEAPQLEAALQKEFGSVDSFRTSMNTKTAAIQGSGWGWLGYCKEKKKLEIVTTANQDPLITHVPLIGIDIWEHAFYLQYKNVKPDYLKAIWSVVNWKEAEGRFAAALS